MRDTTRAGAPAADDLLEPGTPGGGTVRSPAVGRLPEGPPAVPHAKEPPEAGRPGAVPRTGTRTASCGLGPADPGVRARAAAPADFARSLLVEESLPGRRLECSGPLRWRSLLARHYRDPAEADAFTTSPTDDLLVVIVTGGRYVIESRQCGSWTREDYRPGSIGATAPGRASTLRWRSVSSQPLESLHLFLSARLVDDTVREFGRSGLSSRTVPDALLLRDPLVTGLGQAILRALEQGAPALYADSLAQGLVSHLLYGPDASGAGRPGGGPARSRGLDDRALRRITDYMQDHLQEEVTLEQLAAEVHISKYHLLRLFSEKTGLTPHRYLTEMRVTRAASLLLTTDRSILQIALECGYRSPGRFAAAFRRHHGTTPARFRR